MIVSKWEWVKARPLRAWIVLFWLFAWTWIALYSADWHVIIGFLLLFLPVYWQVYLKKDLAPDWW